MMARSTPLAVRIAAFASRRHGIVDLRELDQARVPRSTVKLWVRSGHLHRLHRGVFSIVPPSMLTIEGRWLAAVKAAGPGAVLSHGPAGQHLGIVPRSERFALHVSLGDRARRSPQGVVVHRPRNLADRDTTSRLLIPTTSPTRTVWDLAGHVSPLQVGRAFERAEARDLLSRPRLTELLGASPSRRGAGTIRRLLADRPLPRAEVRSWLEELLREICVDAALPLPAVNVPLLGYEVDFLWQAERLVVEADGGDHLARTQRDSDNERDARLARAGYLVRRFTDRAMTRRAAVAAEVLEILAERRPGRRSR